MVRLKGSRMSWASEVTSRVLSVPSVPCTRTQAPSLWARGWSTVVGPSLPGVAGPGIEWAQSRLYLLTEICAQGLRTLLCSLSCRVEVGGSYLSMPCATRQAVLSASFTCASQWQPSSRLSQRSMLCSRSPQASTRRTKLSCRGRPLHKWESCHLSPSPSW